MFPGGVGSPFVLQLQMLRLPSRDVWQCLWRHSLLPSSRSARHKCRRPSAYSTHIRPHSAAGCYSGPHSRGQVFVGRHQTRGQTPSAVVLQGLWRGQMGAATHQVGKPLVWFFPMQLSSCLPLSRRLAPR
jgi:hypothetical protein